MADIQVNLLHKGSRTTKPRYRQRCAAASSENRQKIWRKCKIVEVPGTSVLSTLVAEVYGPYKGQIKVAKQVKRFCIRWCCRYRLDCGSQSNGIQTGSRKEKQC
jgi:hypothetical protein